MSFSQVSIGRDEAITLAASGWWHDMDAEHVFEWQMLTEELVMDFSDFHAAAEATLKRPVWTHEFARPELLWDEYQGKRVVANPLQNTLEVLAEIMGDKQP
jgi:hypothetical protein